MSRTTQSAEWAKGEPLDHGKLNDMRGVREIRVGPGLLVTRSPDGAVAIALADNPRPLSPRPTRLKVTDASPGGSTGVVKARRWDGTTPTGPDVYVLGVQGHVADDDFAAVMVDGGVPGSPTDPSGGAVVWVEVLILPVSASRYQFVQVVDVHGKLGIDSARFE